MTPTMTYERALDALSLGALEIVCEPLFERYCQQMPAGQLLALTIEQNSPRDVIAGAVRRVWRSVMRDGCGAEWFHNNSAGQQITAALQVLEGITSRRELYRRLAEEG